MCGVMKFFGGLGFSVKENGSDADLIIERLPPAASGILAHFLHSLILRRDVDYRTCVCAFSMKGLGNGCDYVKGVLEDSMQIIANFDKIHLSMDSESSLYVKIACNGPCVVNAGMLEDASNGVVLVDDRALRICEITSEGDRDIVCFISNGCDAENINSSASLTNDFIKMKPSSSLVKHVEYSVRETCAKDVKHDELTLTVRTFVAGDAIKILRNVSKCMSEMFSDLYSSLSKEGCDSELPHKHSSSAKIRKCLLSRLEEMPFSIRAQNSFRAHKLKFCWELCQKSDSDLLRISNLGKKSIGEIVSVLQSYGLHMEYNVDDVLG